MNYELHTKELLDLKLEKFLMMLREMGYAESTLAGYQSYILKSWEYIKAKGLLYSSQTVREFIKREVVDLKYSESRKKHIRTAVRRFDEYLSGISYIFRKPSGRQEPPEIYKSVLDDYVSSMAQKGLKESTIKVG